MEKNDLPKEDADYIDNSITNTQKTKTENQQRLTRRSLIKSGLLVGIGVCAGALGVQVWPTNQPSEYNKKAENLSKAQKRYREQITNWLYACQTYWKDAFSIREITDNNEIYIDMPQTFTAQDNQDRSLRININTLGKLLSLQESKNGFNDCKTELFPPQNDIRKSLNWYSSAGYSGTNVEERWWYTPNDAIYGRKTKDGTTKEMRIDGFMHIDPYEDPEILMQHLSSPQRVAVFQEMFGKGAGADSLSEFIQEEILQGQFRMSFAELQARKFSGNCNDFAEMACETLSRHGYDMHLFSMRPKNIDLTKPWHQVAAYPLDKKGYGFIDQGELTYADSPETFAKNYKIKSDPDIKMVPVGGRAGYLPWKKARTSTARWLQHMGVDL
jgi:hypothetical protein